MTTGEVTIIPDDVDKRALLFAYLISDRSPISQVLINPDRIAQGSLPIECYEGNGIVLDLSFHYEEPGNDLIVNNNWVKQTLHFPSAGYVSVVMPWEGVYGIRHKFKGPEFDMWRIDMKCAPDGMFVDGPKVKRPNHLKLVQ